MCSLTEEEAWQNYHNYHTVGPAVGVGCTGLWELRGGQMPVRLPVQSPEKSRKISITLMWTM